MAASQAATFTAFDYKYRDAGNYKAAGRLVLEGSLSTDDRAMILDRLEAGELFIAEQIGIPTLYIDLYEFTGGPTDDDHCWHEFSGFSDICSSVLDGPTWGKAQGLVAEFQKVSEWDQSLSTHFAI